LISDLNNLIDENEIKKYIWERKNKIEAVVVSGGEPTLQSDLINFLIWLRGTGLKIKLDTNGSQPEVIKYILDKKLIDYVAMDIKTSFEKYNKVCGLEINKNNVVKSINLIKNSKVDYEFRTTVFKKFVELNDLVEIGRLINGAKKYFLQNYVYRESIENGKKILSYSEQELEEVVKILKQKFMIREIEIR
jgi:pyruvate formate lyase activating enzyme